MPSMRRDTGELADGAFDLLVVGGGVVGACAAWDASLRGLRVALVERDDFGGGTSANSLKIVHGGLRHLQGLDLRRARRSAAERRFWLSAAPHLVEPVPFVLPLRGRGLERRSVFRAALGLYDLLARGRNRGLDPSRRVPRGRTLDRRACAELVPGVPPGGTAGGALFHDGLVYDTERLVLELVLAADGAGAAVANHAEFLRASSAEGGTAVAAVRDRLGSGELEVTCRAIVDASGPWSALDDGDDRGRAGDPSAPGPHCVAVNLVTSRPEPEVAFGVRTVPGPGATDADPRRLFVVPWRGQAMVGTGYYAAGGGSASERASALRGSINRAIPGFELGEDEVVLVHEGRLPLEPGTSGPPADRLREDGRVREVGAPDGLPVVRAETVKYTTARHVAERAVDRICRLLGRQGTDRPTRSASLPGAPDGSVAGLVREAVARTDVGLPAATLRHLARAYGRRYRDVLRFVASRPDGADRVVPGTPVTVGELAHAAEEEMAASPEDLLFRRTEIGARGRASAGARRAAESVLAGERAPARDGEPGGG